MNPKKTLKLVLALSAIVSLGTGGCDRDEKISSYSVKPKSSATPPPADTQQPSEQAPAPTGDLTWTAPAGWTVLPPAPMRAVGYAVSKDDPKAILTVVKLPPQPLLENVNRWEGQLSLPPTPQESLEKVVKHVHVGGFHADVVDLTGPQSQQGGQLRMLAALVNTGDATWSIKMTGKPAAIEAQKANFDAFLASIHPGTAPAAAPESEEATESHLPGATPLKSAPPAAAAVNGAVIKGYQLPAGWKKDEQASPMRFLSFKAGADGQGDVAVTRMPQRGFDMQANLNRWLGQAGATSIDQVKRVSFQVGGQEAKGLDIPGGGNDPQRLIIAILPQGEDLWFIRILGPSAVVSEQKGAFEQFLKSIQFGPSGE